MAREWLPSPTANSSGRDAGTPYLLFIALVGREAGQRVGDGVDLRIGELKPLMWPPFSMRSKS